MPSAPGATQLSPVITHGLPGRPHISAMLVSPPPVVENPNNPNLPGGLSFALTPFLLDEGGGSFRIAVTLLATRVGTGAGLPLNLNVRWAVFTR